MTSFDPIGPGQGPQYAQTTQAQDLSRRHAHCRLSGRVAASYLAMGLVGALIGGTAYAQFGPGSGPSSSHQYSASEVRIPPVVTSGPECSETSYEEEGGNTFRIRSSSYGNSAEASIGERLYVSSYADRSGDGKLEFHLPAESGDEPKYLDVQAIDGALHIAARDPGFEVRGEGKEITVVAAGVQNTVVATGENGMKVYLNQQPRAEPRIAAGESILRVPNDGSGQVSFDVAIGGNHGSIGYVGVAPQCEVKRG